MSDQSAITLLMDTASATHERGALAEADALYRRVLNQEPAHAEAIRRRVVIAHQNGVPENALPVLDAAIRADSANPAWPMGRALVLVSLGRHQEALAAYDHAIALQPDAHSPHHGRAATLMALNRFEDALAGFTMAVALKPDAVESHTGRGGALWRLHRFQEAMAAYDRAIEIQEDCAEAWFAKGLLLLLLGHYKEGWELHEWRHWLPGEADQQRLFRQPAWDGAAFHGQMLLLHAEQGLGDTIQFHRFVAMAQRLGGVTVEVQAPLVRLLAAQPNAPLVIARGQPLPRFDAQYPLMSLPLLFGTELHAIPTAPFYLQADPALAATWVSRLPPPVPGTLRVGIAWSGNPTAAHNHNRSLPLTTMLAMFGPETAVISLQKDMTPEDRATLSRTVSVTDLGGALTDMADTAAVISQLDLVISVCTSVAHLAGALGKPVWVLLAADADWRWLVDRADSPWYPTAHLFRQSKPGDWNSVAERVRRALEDRRALNNQRGLEE